METARQEQCIVIDVQKIVYRRCRQRSYFAQSPDQKKDTLIWISQVEGPDFQDPSTYLDILEPNRWFNLDMGLDPIALIEKIGLNQYRIVGRC